MNYKEMMCGMSRANHADLRRRNVGSSGRRQLAIETEVQQVDIALLDLNDWRWCKDGVSLALGYGIGSASGLARYFPTDAAHCR